MLIKFRSWDHRNKTMYFPDNIANNIDGGKYHIQQFTGLKDKNGKEIYEGDILGGTWGDGYIAWCDKCVSFQYLLTTGDCAACSGDIAWYELAADNGKLEVIGNIYENPELIGGE